jgi:hypothetical protein
MKRLIIVFLTLILLLTLFVWIVLYHGSGHIIPLTTDISFSFIVISTISLIVILLKKGEMKILNFAVITLSTFIGMVLTYCINFYLLENVIIPDPCYYHSHDTNVIFDIFYELPAWNGDHPVPTIFNMTFTIAIGAILGGIISTKALKRKDKAPNR